MLRYLYFNESIEDAVQAPRIYNRFSKMGLRYEDGFSHEIIHGLKKIGHKMSKISPEIAVAAITAIGRDGKYYVPVYDHRRLGSAEVF